PPPPPPPPPVLPLIAAGDYRFTDVESAFPLLAASIDGLNWFYRITSQFPMPPIDSINQFTRLTSASCNLNVCIAGGLYFSDVTNFPLLALSTDKGVTWSYKITSSSPALPAGTLSGSFADVSCNSSVCIAGGRYSSTAEYPLLATSLDNGATWQYTLSENTPSAPSDFSNGQFSSVSCSGGTTNNVCVAAGSYTNAGFTRFPLIATSINRGQSWTYTVSSSTPTLPENTDEAFFNSVSCYGTTCIAAGQHFNGVEGVGYPLLASSTNGGLTWTYRIFNGTPTLPSDFTSSGIFTDTSCSATTCVASGRYINTGGNLIPLLATSTNNGVTWSFRISSSSPALPADFASGSLSSVTCLSNNCIAAGNYTDIGAAFLPEHFYPLLAASSDNGLTWTYRITSSTPGLPAGYIDAAFLNSVSCNEQNCIAAGTYGSLDEPIYPLVAVSKNRGTNWTYVINRDSPTLPGDFISGGFEASAAAKISPIIRSLLRSR
ncbi:sialidase family protein, partial [Legionella resiliens]